MGIWVCPDVTRDPRSFAVCQLGGGRAGSRPAGTVVPLAEGSCDSVQHDLVSLQVSSRRQLRRRWRLTSDPSTWAM